MGPPQPRPAPLPTVNGHGAAETTDLIAKHKISRLAKDIDPTGLLEDDVIELLLKLSEDFVDNVVMGSCTLGNTPK